MINRLFFLDILLVFSCIQDKSNVPAGFQIEPEFNLELASEPLIKDPVDLEFNERGDPEQSG